MGVTTLEEVFLRIGHGEEEQTRMIDNNNAADGDEEALVKKIDAETQRLEEYSITTDAESSVFFLHMCAIMRKKILMQVRDQKTLVVDTIFPITLIIFGMYLATIQILKSGVARDMSVTSIYPGPINLLYNEYTPTNAGLAPTVFTDFVNDNIVAFNTTAFHNDGDVWPNE